MKKPIRSVRYIGNQLLGSFEFLFPISLLTKRLLDPDGIEGFISCRHNICIAGPPRSANTFATHVFRFWNQDALIAHHVHLPNQVLFAVKWNIPCVVLLRNPLDAISSNLALDRLSIGTAIFSYVNFYNRIAKVRDRVTVVKFEDVIKNPQIMVSQLNSKFGTSFFSAPLTEQQEAEIFSNIKNNPNRKLELLIAIPDPRKDERKSVIKPLVIKHPLFNRAVSVYDEWTRFANKVRE